MHEVAGYPGVQGRGDVCATTLQELMAKRLRDEPDVTLLVGPQRERVPAYSQILALSSDFFDAALGTSMLEAQTKEIALPDQDPETVRLLLEYVNPGSEVTLTAANILTLVPLLHQFQFAVGLKEADSLCSRSGSMSWDSKRTGFVGTPVALLQAGVEYCLENTRATAMKQIISDLKRGERFHELEPLATDGRYTEQMRELWPAIRALVLSPKQQADGDMAEPPDPACCKVVWPALEYSLARRNCIAAVAANVYSALPHGEFVCERTDEDEEDDDLQDRTTTLNDHIVRALLTTYVSNSLPGHWQGASLVCTSTTSFSDASLAEHRRLLEESNLSISPIGGHCFRRFE